MKYCQPADLNLQSGLAVKWSDNDADRSAKWALFYAGDRQEPPHIHVERDDCLAKFWLEPVRLQRSGGFDSSEISRIEKLVAEQSEQLLKGWNEYFSR